MNSDAAVAAQPAQLENDSPKKILDETIASIELAAKTEAGRAWRLRWSNNLFSFSSAILGVGAPTLVTYFAQDPGANPIMKLVAILAAAFAGATTVLLGTFRWGQRYGQSSLAAISLRELASSTRLRLQDVQRTTKEDAVPEKVHAINHESQKIMYEILRGVIQNEVAVFSKSSESPNSSSLSSQKMESANAFKPDVSDRK